MGIDAELLIRGVSAKTVSDEWLRETSWRLCQSIGAKHFFITDGLTPVEYVVAHKAWHEAFNSHPSYPQFDAASKASNNYQDPRSAEYRAQWQTARNAIIADIGESPKERRLAIERTLTRYREDDDPPPGAEYREDSDTPIKARRDECLLELSLYGRYYGPGYERGDILIYCAMAEWLEVNIPGCEVWYGGDSSGVCAEPFTEAKRRDLRNHLYGAQGRDYFNRDGWGGKPPVMPKACSLCPMDRYHGNQFGFGQHGAYAAFHCDGCGKSVETRDSGSTWTEKKDD
jgi:hypothetical protein